MTLVKDQLDLFADDDDNGDDTDAGAASPLEQGLGQLSSFDDINARMARLMSEVEEFDSGTYRRSDVAAWSEDEAGADGADGVKPPDAPPPGGGGRNDPPPPLPPLPGDGDSLPLALYAERAYLEYAVSVVKGRALPDVCDGQKPVQRRILYAMRRMGLTPTSKPVKSAGVVGEVLGKFHPHGDSSVYEAMVRLAQDFTLRYPLVDGHGNFGTRDGDSAAAMRYTESRLTALAGLLLDEIDRGTVDFIPTYDGSNQEPTMLPARLPMVLLNGASGIAVGMATEIPPHNLREVGKAAVALLQNPRMSTADLLEIIPGPDFPGGGQLISSAADIQAAYEVGRGSLKLRARWKIEERARGQWQVVITELPHGVSTQKVLEELEDLTNPKVKPGKKTLSQEQSQLKGVILSLLDTTRDESGKDFAVRLVLEPKSSRISQADFMNTLLANTSLECSFPMNLVMIGADGRPRQKSLHDILHEWCRFRVETVRRRTRFHLEHVLDRIHVLEGRAIVYLNVDAVIRTIREAEEPKMELMEAFTLTERQAEDILEMRLRQLARLDGIKVEQDLAELRGERRDLEYLLDNESALQDKVIEEIEADVAKFGDARRTLLEETRRAAPAINVVDDPLTVILSEKGWLRARNGHGLDVSTLTFKEGDALSAAVECRTTDSVVFMGTDGRAYTVGAAQIPGGRGDGVPVTTLVEVQPKTRIGHMLCARPEQLYLMASSGGYGFVCKFGDLVGRLRAGKGFVTIEEGETLLKPLPFQDDPSAFVGTVGDNGRVHAFPLMEMKTLSQGGRGVQMVQLEDDERLLGYVVTRDGIVIEGTSGRSQKITAFTYIKGDWEGLLGKRGRRGRELQLKLKNATIRAWAPPEPTPPATK